MQYFTSEKIGPSIGGDQGLAHVNQLNEIVVEINQRVTKTVKVTIGDPTATGVDHNFTSASNKTQQSIELEDILPAFASVLNVLATCTQDWAGSAGDETNITAELGTTSGAADIIDGSQALVNNLQLATPIGLPATTATIDSLWFSITPTVNNFSQFTGGKITLWITYIDNAAAV